jgi:uncharacterized protein with von Willebrand factor type A (vWA) domain
VQTLFDYARSQFKDLKTYYFHNTIYDTLWKDPARSQKPYSVDELMRLDPETRFIIMGDASMAPFELSTRDGSMHIQDREGRTSLESLKYIAKTFSHTAWLNPIQENMWWQIEFGQKDFQINSNREMPEALIIRPPSEYLSLPVRLTWVRKSSGEPGSS